MAEILKPAPKLPSLILPIKKPLIQHWMIMPTEKILSWSCMAMVATEERSELTMPVIMVVVNATIVVVTAISALHMNASKM